MTQLDSIDPEIGRLLVDTMPSEYESDNSNLKWKYAAAMQCHLHELASMSDSPSYLKNQKFLNIKDFYHHRLAHINHHTDLYGDVISVLHGCTGKVDSVFLQALREALQKSVAEFKEELPEHFKNIEMFRDFEINRMMNEMDVGQEDSYRLTLKLYYHFKRSQSRHNNESLQQYIKAQPLYHTAQMALMQENINKLQQEIAEFRSLVIVPKRKKSERCEARTDDSDSNGA